MRNLFARLLHNSMKTNKDIYLLTADLGFGVWNEVREEFPDRAINTGAREQATLDMAVGLAQEGKIPFVYSITPFLIYRGFETLRTYVDHERTPIKLVGSGRDQDYKKDGFSHDATDVAWFLGLLPDIEQYYPNNEDELKEMFFDMLTSKEPSFISLKR